MQLRHRYFILNKPHNMVSQFVGNDAVRQLGELEFNFPEGIHAIGRLDSASEGLLILTTNKKVTKLLFESKTPHSRTYLVLVQGEVSNDALQLLQNGISFKTTNNRTYTTAPCKVSIVAEPQFNFVSPYTKNNYIEYTWLKMTLTEGKYHQIRKMTFAVRHRCVRLVRTSIEMLELGNLPAGAVQEVAEKDFFEKLNINPN